MNGFVAQGKDSLAREGMQHGQWRWGCRLHRIFVPLLVACFLGGEQLWADDTTATDVRTPPELAVGTPDGTYHLSSLETYSPYTGSLTIHVPLLRIGGRGEAAFEMPLIIQPQWEAVARPDAVGNLFIYALPRTSIKVQGGGYLPIIPAQSPGEMFLRQAFDSSAGSWPCTLGSPGYYYSYYFGNLLTRITFIDSFGTQHDLVDTKTDGQPMQSQQPPAACGLDPLGAGAQGFSRGTTFRAMDSSNITFVSDNEIHDVPVFNSTGYFANPPAQHLSGWLYFPNGIKYRVTSGQPNSGNVIAVEDRNGNEVTATSTGWIDSLNRQVQISGSSIQYLGTGSVPRTISVEFTTLGNALDTATSQTVQNMSAMFPVNYLTPDTQFNPAGVVKSITLPDQSKYQFTYTSYGDVASITLPTGGRITYQWPSATPSASSCQTFCVLQYSDVEGNPAGVVYRRLLGRMEFAPESTKTPTRQTVYEYSIDSRLNAITTVTEKDGSGSVLSITKHHMLGDPTSTVDLQSTNNFYSNEWNGKEVLTEFEDAKGNVLRSVAQTWQPRPCSTAEHCWFATASDSFAHDPQLASVQVTEGSTVRNTSYSYDVNNNVTDEFESDWGNSSTTPPILRHTKTTFNPLGTIPNASPAFGLIVDLPSEVKVMDGSSNLFADATYSYDENLGSEKDESGIIGHDQTAYGYQSTTTRGNLTSEQHCLITGTSKCITWNAAAHAAYDIAGNKVSVTDSNTNKTTLSYVDNFSDGSSPGAYAYLTQITYPAANQSAKAQTAEWQYDSGTGKVTQSIDVNGVPENYVFNDKLDRVTQITKAAGTAAKTQINASYSAAGTFPVSVDVYSDQNTFAESAANGGLHSATLYDGFGRVQESRQYESSGYISVAKTYDALGRLSSATNPYRPNDATWGSQYATSYQYDALNRLAVTTTPDMATVTTTYNGNQTTVTDQAGKARTTVSDGLGRLIAVIEDPSYPAANGSSAYTGLNYTTIYGYDPLGDLLCVNQGGSATVGGTCSPGAPHGRSFVYDAMKHLTAATNPETGTIKYTYDAVGNLLAKTDARSIITCYGKTIPSTSCSNDGYDALNRPTVKSYSDATPQVTYTYGDALSSSATAVPNSLGRLVQTSNGVSTSNILGYDELGRVTGSSQTTQGANSPYKFAYSYNLASALVSETLPSGRMVATTYDGANRPATLQGTMGTVKTSYVGTTSAPIQYTPHGATWSFARGNGLTHTEDYNARLQVVQSYESLQNTNDPAHMLFVSCPQWGYGAGTTQAIVVCPSGPTASDNGNLIGYVQKMGMPGASSYATISQPTITYDGVNRLTGITETNNWSRSFAYDQWGNMSITSVSGITSLDVNAPVVPLPSAPAIYDANNRRTDAGLGYDAAGNLNAINLFTAKSIQYDAENRLVAESHPAAYTYGYDGNGQRVTKTGPGGTTFYVYDAAGGLSAEYVSAGLTAPACATCYLSYDHLGSVRLITDGSGTVISRHDFLPFGDEMPMNIGPRTTALGYGSSDYVSQRFTGKERDQESGLDYFGARYYGSGMGRFSSPDPSGLFFSDALNPQSLNLYSYVQNRPLSYADPDGLSPCGGGEVQIGVIPCILSKILNFFKNTAGGSDDDNSISGGGSGYPLLQRWSTSQPTSGHFLTVALYPSGAGWAGHLGDGLDTNKTSGWATAAKFTFLDRMMVIVGVPFAGLERRDHVTYRQYADKTSGMGRPFYLYRSISNSQYAVLQDRIAMRYNPQYGIQHQYELFLNSCGQYVGDDLRAASIPGAPPRFLFAPWFDYLWLRAQTH